MVLKQRCSAEFAPRPWSWSSSRGWISDGRMMPKRWGISAVGCLLAVAGVGCSTIPDEDPVTDDELATRCEKLFHDLDGAVDRAGVRDGGTARVAGFRYLRANRFLASFRDEFLDRDQECWWIERMRQLEGRHERSSWPTCRKRIVLSPGRRVALRIAAATHYIQHVRYDDGGPTEQKRYTFVHDDRLRSLEGENDIRYSLLRPGTIFR